MTTISFFKAGNELEQYRNEAINYIAGEKVKIINSARDLGMLQINTAIAGAMVEERRLYL